MLDIVNGNDVGEIAVGATQDATSFGEGEGRTAVEIHRFVAAEGFHNLGLTQEGNGGEKGDVKELSVARKADRTSDGTAHDRRISEAFFSRVNRHSARSE